MSLNTLYLLSPEEQESILDGPALRPPPGMEPNFDHPPNRNIIPQSVIPICLVLVTLAFLLRGYGRLFISKSIHVDDILIVLGFGTYIAYIYCIYHSVHSVGFFVHQWNASVRSVSGVQHILQLGANFYNITLLLTKAAVLLQWIRIFAPKGTRGVFFWACQVILWINIIFYLSVTVAGNLICVPFQRIWDKTVPGICYNGRPLNLTLGAVNFVSDILILLLPQAVIWRLNMTLKRRLGIALTFAVGLIACTAAGVRLGVTVRYLTDPDWLYRVSGLSMACIAEMTCILLVYCMPGIPMAFTEPTILTKFFGSFRSSLLSVTRLRNPNTSTGSHINDETPCYPGMYNQMGAYHVSLDEFRRASLARSESTDQLEGRSHNVS